MITLEQLKPVPPYIVVEPVDPNEGSNIVIAAEYQDAPQRAVVRAVWDDTTFYSTETPQLLVGPGDEVLHAKYGAVEINDSDFALLHHDDIYCIVKNGSETK